MSSSVSFYAIASFGNTKAYHDALSQVPDLKYANMYMAQSLIDEHDAEKANAVKGIRQFYVQALNIYAFSSDFPNTSTKHGDGYDGQRIQFSPRLQLHDPAPDVASLYRFDEDSVLMMAYFAENKPVNHSKGYQAIQFDDAGQVTQFSYINSANAVQKLDMNDDIPEAIQPVVAYLKTLTAPSRVDTLEHLAAINPSLDVR